MTARAAPTAYDARPYRAREQRAREAERARGQRDHRRLGEQPPREPAQRGATGTQQGEFGAAAVGGEAARHQQDDDRDRTGAEGGDGDQGPTPDRSPA